jgi:probable HAF family extracellular repeat protein
MLPASNRRILLFSLSLALAAGQAGAQTHLIGIVPPAGESTIAFDMNAAGQVAAVFENGDGHQRGVLFEKGVTTELALLPGAYSDTKAINANGEVVGSAENEAGHSRAYLYARAKGMRDLGTLGGTSSFGMDINRAGQAVGFADTADGDDHAFFYDGKKMRDLGTLGGKISYASGMNNVGQVVGTAALADNYRRAFVYDAVHGMVNLGTLGGRSSAAVAINDAGTIVGASETADHKWHAFVYEGKRMVDLGALIGRGSSFATGINNAGHVVGTVLVGDERRTFVWRDGAMTVHRGGKGLYLTNRINDGEQVIGATYFRTLEAATMPSNASAAVARSVGTTLVPAMAFSLLAAGAAVFWRRRYRGMTLPRHLA